jgi:hypothetical protein
MPVAIAPGETQQAVSGQHGISQGVPSDRHTTGYRVTLYLSRTPCSIRDRGQGTRLQPRDTKYDCAMETRAHDCATKTKVTHRCLFCPLFLFQICLNYFFAQKIRYVSVSASLRLGIAPSWHRFSILCPHPRERGYGTRLRHGGQGHPPMPFLSTIFISNLFELFFRPKNTASLRLGIAPSRHRSVSASLRLGIDSASMPTSLRARLLRHRNGRG